MAKRAKKTRRKKPPRKPRQARGYYDPEFGCRFSKDGWPLYPGMPLVLRLK